MIFILENYNILIKPNLFQTLGCMSFVKLQVLGLSLGVDFTFTLDNNDNNNNDNDNNPHLNFFKGTVLGLRNKG